MLIDKWVDCFMRGFGRYYVGYFRGRSKDSFCFVCRRCYLDFVIDFLG